MATSTRSQFGNQLRQQLDQHHSIKSVRRLAYVMSPSRPDSARRMLHEWIAGTKKPTRASRQSVATALGIDPSIFANDDEDDEDAMVDLLGALQRIVKKRKVSGDRGAVLR